MIDLDDVHFGYDGQDILRGVTAEITPGSFHFLTGPSGAGKTTLMKLFYLEHQATGGVLRIFGDNPASLSATRIAEARRRIGVIFQDFRLLDHLNVLENIALPLRAAGKSVEGHRADILELVRWVGLEHRADASPPQLSAGEKQRAAIARAVINSPDLVLADEPTGNVDPEMGARILRLLSELNRLGKTIIIATHDLGLIRAAKASTDVRILRLADGVLSQGTEAL